MQPTKTELEAVKQGVWRGNVMLQDMWSEQSWWSRVKRE